MDLSTTYLGSETALAAGAGGFAAVREMDTIKQMEDAGAAAVVLYSLFEEQLRQDRLELAQHLEHGTNSFAEALTYFPEPEEFRLGPEEYLKHIAKAKAAVQNADHRQPERLVGRRLDAICQGDRAGRRGRAGAEHLLHPHRHEPDLDAGGADLPGHPARR